MFVFWRGTRVLFQGNNFDNNNIQTQCIPSKQHRDSSDDTGSEKRVFGELSLIGNRGLQELGILEGYSVVSFTGVNRIERLWLSQLSEPDEQQLPAVHFGPRERIDSQFDYPLHHRRVFVSLKHIAAMNHDRHQERALDSQLERIEYFLNKEQDTPRWLDCSDWIEYWQDRVLHVWRKWSANFYRSWLRPLLMLVIGYLVFSIIPGFIVTGFFPDYWIEFTLSPISAIAGYERDLDRIMGSDYSGVSTSTKNAFRALGVVQKIWIAMWSFAFAKSIRR